MKTITILHTILILISLSACRIKDLNFQKSRALERRTSNTSAENKQAESYQNNRVISVIDSADQLYHVKIFPLDSFTYSIRDGFKGKASGIELIGSAKQVRKINEHEQGSFTRETDSVHTSDSTMSDFSKSLSRELTKKYAGGLALAVSLLVLWVWLYLRIRRRFQSAG